MKFVRFQHNNKTCYGVLEDKKINIIHGDIFSDYSLTGEYVFLNDIKLLAPCIPTKAVCVGLNYYDHAAELKMQLPTNPLIFLKPSSALNYHNGRIEYPAITNNLHYEAELAIVIGKIAKNVQIESAYDYILGYTCANDVTARDIQLSDGQWTRGKSCDTFLPLGPCIESEFDPHNANIKLYLNDELKQSSNTRNLIFKVPELVAFITQAMTLYPGDVILTGTPSGVGPMQTGDLVTVEIEGIGKLCNTIAKGE